MEITKFEKNYQQLYQQLTQILSKDDIHSCIEFMEEKTPLERMKFFASSWFDYVEQMSQGNLEFFHDVQVELFPGITFYPVMKKMSSENQDVIWFYLHTLYTISIRHKKIKKLYKDHDASKYFSHYVNNMVEFKRKKQQVQHVEQQKKIEDTEIGKLAKEIQDEIKVDESFLQHMNIENPMDIFKILQNEESKTQMKELFEKVVQSFTNKVKNGQVNPETLFKDGQQTYQNMLGIDPSTLFQMFQK